jgi:hypothetical protein
MWAIGDNVMTQDVAEAMAPTIVPKWKPSLAALFIRQFLARHHLTLRVPFSSNMAQTHWNKSVAVRLFCIGNYHLKLLATKMSAG